MNKKMLKPNRSRFILPCKFSCLVSNQKGKISTVGMGHFHSRGQQLCKFIATKGNVQLRKISNRSKSARYTVMAAGSLFWNINMATLTSCGNAPHISSDISFTKTQTYCH